MVQRLYGKWSGNAVSRINSETETCFQWKTELDTKRRAYSTAFIYHQTPKEVQHAWRASHFWLQLTTLGWETVRYVCQPISF
jgi:hypothetical protein